MIISIASGKGGTGKTTVATNLALVLGDRVELLDCDVEEPNAHLFLKPQIDRTEQALIQLGHFLPSASIYLRAQHGRIHVDSQLTALILPQNAGILHIRLCFALSDEGTQANSRTTASSASWVVNTMIRSPAIIRSEAEGTRASKR